MANIIDNFNKIYSNINNICHNNGINYPIKIIAVSKTFPTKDIAVLYETTGHNSFAESYAQELYYKSHCLQHLDISWHFIGNIQSNKIKYIANCASWVHSLENIKHATLLNNLRSYAKPKLNVLIEVNVSQGSQKHGVKNHHELLHLIQEIKKLDKLQFRGLMAIGSATMDTNIITKEFCYIQHMFQQLQKLVVSEVDTLSLGMSSDYEKALLYGSTMVRIGTLIFGKRS